MGFTCEIDGKIYEQRPLVLGQVKQMLDIMQGVKIPAGIDALGLINLLGDRLPLALAVVLTEKGKSPRGKNLEEFAAELEFALSPEQTMEIINDFFAVNPLSSILEKLAEMMEMFTAKMAANKIGSQRSASLSAMETLPGENESSGA